MPDDEPPDSAANNLGRWVREPPPVRLRGDRGDDAPPFPVCGFVLSLLEGLTALFATWETGRRINRGHDGFTQSEGKRIGAYRRAWATSLAIAPEKAAGSFFGARAIVVAARVISRTLPPFAARRWPIRGDMLRRSTISGRFNGTTSRLCRTPIRPARAPRRRVDI